MKKRVILIVFGGAIIAAVGIRLHGVNAQAMQSSVNGVPNQTVSLQGVLPLYNPDGTPIVGGKCVQSIVTSVATTGQFSMSYSALGFTNITSFRAQVQSPSTTLTVLGNMYTANVVSATSTQLTGTVTSPTSIVIGGLPVVFGPSATQVSVGVCGA